MNSADKFTPATPSGSPPNAPPGSASGATRHAAFEAELQPILDKAYAVAYRLTGNRDDAQDVVQDAAIQAFRAFDSYQSGTNFKAWFTRILVNRFLNVRRSAERRPQTVSIDEAEDFFLFQEAKNRKMLSRGSDPAAALTAKIDRQLIADALLELPPEFRAVATLYLIEDYSYEEIARVLEVPIGTVRSRLHRGRKLLQKSLWEIARERNVISS